MDHGEHIEQLFKEYEEQRKNMTTMHERMKAVQASATSARREVTVTVGPNGAVLDVKFPTGGYRRMTPAELTSVIMQTYQEAKNDVLDQAADLLAPQLPAGLDARALMRGETTTDALMPQEMRMSTSLREALGLGRPTA